MRLPRVVIIGGGFGGLTTAQGLKDADVKVTLVDRTNHHLFQPLLYQVASAALAPRDIAFPIREVLKKQDNTAVVMDEVAVIDTDARMVALASGRILEYDYLVVAVGTRHSYFGHPEWEKHAPGIKTLEDAIAMKRQILTAFEAAEVSDSHGEAERLLTFVVVGGGPTGVELAGAIAEVAQKTMLKNFRRIDPSDTKVYLIEAGPRLLSTYPEKLSEYARKNLTELGVTVLTGALVTALDDQMVTMGDRTIATTNVFWAAGNKAPELLSTLGVPLDPQYRVVVRPDLSIPDHGNVFVIGDAAYCMDDNGSPLPGVAPVALQQGRYVADVINKRLLVSERQPFHYHDKGSMATIGKAKAIASVGKRCFTGFFAWMLWSTVHIAFLIGFRSRVIVMLEWFFWYVTGKRGSRLIYEAVCRNKAEGND
ncbi:Uncharacterized protein SCG7086_AP_00030 [Chlamydiales bacterium SCGC AG-110-P3]|nr:Uncharacterized protein SCG7086_AP_00030 [Chlamydiales bacterium SCGC AG-110-P3]